MKNKIMKIALLLGLMNSLVVAFNKVNAQRQTAVTGTRDTSEIALGESLLARGEYLVTIMGCNDCHSPKVFGPRGPIPDPERLLSGHPADMAIPKVDLSKIGNWVLFNDHNTAAIGPWGASFAANITPDATGIGNWTEEQFKRAMRQGKYKGLENSRALLPPMPWPSYTILTDDDIKAIFTYLKSIKPVQNVPPSPKSPDELN